MAVDRIACGSEAAKRAFDEELNRLNPKLKVRSKVYYIDNVLGENQIRCLDTQGRLVVEFVYYPKLKKFIRS